MIDKDLLIKTVEEALEGSDKYLVAVTVSPADLINVEIDSDSNVDIDTCARITRQIESVFDRDAEDYELEVGSAGLTRSEERRVGKECSFGFRSGWGPVD